MHRQDDMLRAPVTDHVRVVPGQDVHVALSVVCLYESAGHGTQDAPDGVLP